MNDIAVVGMVSRVPGAEDIEAFWEMLSSGKEGLRTLTPDELQHLPHNLQQNYIAAGGYIDGIDLFDADLFAFNAREAAMMDPQHRLWLQACWQVLAISGHANKENRNIGVFACAGANSYLKQLLLHLDSSEQQGILLGNVPDCLATRVSYILNLIGPSMTIQSGCSSSLVALHQARLALLLKQCDAALVGGICITVPQHQGYVHIEGGFASPDGHCRPFSDDAAGTVFSSGYGVVLIKRLEDALQEGDCIYAVLKGSAINNDGADKASFTAPSVTGQAAVIAKALRVAGLTANDIQYIEAHGTATPIGDPIELAALEQAFQQSTQEIEQIHTIGSVKANIGHLDVAAGIIGFIKTCLMLFHKKLTPQLYFSNWNPKYPNANKRFNINVDVKPWPAVEKRRAGVSAFGFGGTNAHVILEEAPERGISTHKPSLVSQLIILSAKSSERLIKWVDSLHKHLQKHPETLIEELAYTLQTGLAQLPCRTVVCASSINELIAKLSRISEKECITCLP
ncbi:MAG: hypothetical protein H0U73_09730, partial [Tatlockia sp.]|nr:hypothetical protein [Tatlockia sp.]